MRCDARRGAGKGWQERNVAWRGGAVRGVAGRCEARGCEAVRRAVEARNLAPLPASIDHVNGAALPMAGLTAWQALCVHGRLEIGQTVMIHGAAGGVGSLAVQLAREAGARVIGTGRAVDRQTVLDLGADAFLDLENEPLEGAVDLVFDVIGGEVLDRSAALVSPGGTLVTIAAPPKVRPENGRAIFFIVEPDRDQLAALARKVADGRLKPVVGSIRLLAETREAFQSKVRTPGKTIIQVS